MKNKIKNVVMITLFCSTYAWANTNINCFAVGWFNDGGDPLCAIACSDGTLYPMSCDSDLMKQIAKVE